MRIDIGAVVRTGEGKDVGKVYKVIIDPHQNKATHLVVEAGTFLRRLIVIPMGTVRRANQHRVWLRLSEKEVGEMPDFIETEYAAPPQGWIPPFNYPQGSVLWPAGYIYVPMMIEQEKRVPRDSVEINEGTEVFALDGKIGVVDQVVVDPESKRVTGFVVAKGVQLPRDVFIPIGWVAAEGGDRLSLNRTKGEVIAEGEARAAA